MLRTTAAILIIAALVVAVVAILVTRPQPPELPVTCTFRKELLSDGEVAQLHNNSNAPRKIEVDIANATTRQNVQMFEFIGAHGMTEIGWLQGWRFVPGETLRFHQAGFADARVVVP